MFYGWKLALIISFGNFILQGSALYMMNVFMEPLVDLYGWSRISINMALGMASLCSSVATPFIVSLATRGSLRTIITGAILLGGLSFVLLGYTSNIWIFTIFLSLLWIAGQAFGGVGATVLMERWFFRYRARAFGIVSIGVSFAGVVFPFLGLFLVESLGIMWAYTTLGVLVLFFAPVVYYMVRDTPESMGLSLDGELKVSEVGRTTEKMPPSITRRELLQNPALWIIGCSVSISVMVMVAVVSQLKPHFVDEGFASHTAVLWISLYALCAAFGKYFWGLLCELVTPLKVLKLFLFCNTLSLSCILLPHNTATALSFAIAYGLCSGGIWVLLPVVIEYMFGRQNFLSAYQLILVFIIFKAAGYPILGFSYDMTNSYRTGYALFVALLLVASCASLLLKEASASGYKQKSPEQRHDIIL